MEQGNPHNKKKLQERIALELNTFFRQHVSDMRLQFVTITHVELSADNAYAKVFWDSFQSEKRGDMKAAIAGVSGRARKHLAQIIRMRQIPELRFSYNAQYEAQQHIEDLLAKNSS